MIGSSDVQRDAQLPGPVVNVNAAISRLADLGRATDDGAYGAADRPNGRGGSSGSGGTSSSGSGSGIDRSDCVHQLFEQQAAAQPEAICLIDGDRRLSYGTVNSLANQLARHLADAGVTADVAVGVSLAKSVRLYVSLLAVLKAGGCYVPLDPSLPAERAAFMLKQAGAHMLLADPGSSVSKVSSVQTMHVGDPMGADWECGSLPDSNLPSRCMPADLYSIIYTR
jgi:non-ribosomal peptide synthetase component F